MDLTRMRLDGSDLDRMTESLFFEGMKRRTRPPSSGYCLLWPGSSPRWA